LNRKESSSQKKKNTNKKSKNKLETYNKTTDKKNNEKNQISSFAIQNNNKKNILKNEIINSNGIKQNNIINNLRNTNEKAQIIIKIDTSNNHKTNIDHNKKNKIRSKKDEIEEEKKESKDIYKPEEVLREKIINYKQMNLKDILNLEFFPKKKLENENKVLIENDNKIELNNDKHDYRFKENKTNKLNMDFYNNQTSFETKEEINIIFQNQTNSNNENLILENSNIVDILKSEHKNDHEVKNSCIKDFKDKNIKSAHIEGEKLYEENSSKNISDYLKENITQFNNIREENNKRLNKSRLYIENIRLIDNLKDSDYNYFNENNEKNQTYVNNINKYEDINHSCIINFSKNINYESDVIKIENSVQDKNENDTDTAYSSSNQSENINYNAETIDLHGFNDNCISNFDEKNPNNLKFNNNKNDNLIDLKKNLKKFDTKKSNLIDASNNKICLISPNKNIKKRLNENFYIEFNNVDIGHKCNNILNNMIINDKFSKNDKINSFNNQDKIFLKVENDKTTNNDGNDILINSNNHKDNDKFNIHEDKIKSSNNKINFTLNPLASIYKLSNKNSSYFSNKKNMNFINNSDNSSINEEIITDKININKRNSFDEYSDNIDIHIELVNSEKYLKNNNMNGKINNFKKNCSNYNLNSPNSTKSEKSYYLSKNDLYFNQNQGKNFYPIMGYNPLYSGTVNPFNNNFIFNNQKKYYEYISPKEQKINEYIYNQSKNNGTREKDIIEDNIDQNQTNTDNLDSGDCENKIIKEHGKNPDNNFNSVTEIIKEKFKNKSRRNSPDETISKDNSKIPISKALIFNKNNNDVDDFSTIILNKK